MPAGPPSAAARSALGELKLTMHYYNADPARRFVILDGERYGEGQSTAKGMKVTEIRADGVLGEYQGETFFLSRASGG
jgi:general secretion pathway protein B